MRARHVSINYISITYRLYHFIFSIDAKQAHKPAECADNYNKKKLMI